ncbi:hypothetical protein PFISCL1PPCAC_22784, partial [Pristionchus fissidentatus]
SRGPIRQLMWPSKQSTQACVSSGKWLPPPQKRFSSSWTVRCRALNDAVDEASHGAPQGRQEGDHRESD